MICEAFAQVLRSGRDDFNSRFAEARRCYPDLEGSSFSEFLENDVDQLVRAAALFANDELSNFVSGTYNVALELVGQKLVGTGARQLVVGEVWRKVFPKILPILVKNPESLIASLCNATYNIWSIQGTRTHQWISDLENLGPQCNSSEHLLKLGQILAWRTGLAHYREGALSAMDSLPETLALKALAAPSDQISLKEIRNRLEADPWFDPSKSAGQSKAMNETFCIMHRAGSFRGFGGLFTEPPIVTATDKYFLVQSSDEHWLLIADVFGATFHRATTREFQEAQKYYKSSKDIALCSTKIRYQSRQIDLSDLGEFSSIAANETTLAVTSPLAHNVLLIALTQST